MFYGVKVETDNQFLLLFSIRHVSGKPSAQFFVGANLVRVEEIDDDEQVAIVLDVPGGGIPTYVVVRLASSISDSAFGFKGVDCYLL